MAVESSRFSQLAGLPARPGCYIFRDGGGAVLYVGKSASLRARVRSYFHRPLPGRTGELVARVEEIETIPTESETAARVLEAELIRRHAPPFNVRQEQVPYLCLTLSEPFPRVRTAARPEPGRDRYFGPYADPATVGALLRVLHEVFELQIEEHGAATRPAPRLPEDHSTQSRREYRAAVNGAIRFLEGDTVQVALVLQERMEDAAAALAFEEAARLRDLWRAVIGGR